MLVCEKQPIKTMLGIFNCLSIMCGVLLVSIGIYLVVITFNSPTFLLFKVLVAIILTFGGMAVFLGVCQCFGRFKEGYYMITVYALLMMPLAVLEWTVGVISLTHLADVEYFARKWFGFIFAAMDNESTCNIMETLQNQVSGL
jgi:hypothetical protein